MGFTLPLKPSVRSPVAAVTSEGPVVSQLPVAHLATFLGEKRHTDMDVDCSQ